MKKLLYLVLCNYAFALFAGQTPSRQMTPKNVARSRKLDSLLESLTPSKKATQEQKILKLSKAERRQLLWKALTKEDSTKFTLIREPLQENDRTSFNTTLSGYSIRKEFEQFGSNLSIEQLELLRELKIEIPQAFSMNRIGYWMTRQEKNYNPIQLAAGVCIMLQLAGKKPHKHFEEETLNDYIDDLPDQFCGILLRKGNYVAQEVAQAIVNVHTNNIGLLKDCKDLSHKEVKEIKHEKNLFEILYVHYKIGSQKMREGIACKWITMSQQPKVPGLYPDRKLSNGISLRGVAAENSDFKVLAALARIQPKTHRWLLALQSNVPLYSPLSASAPPAQYAALHSYSPQWQTAPAESIEVVEEKEEKEEEESTDES